jgi:hypothetical protein
MPVISVSLTTYILVSGDTGLFIDLGSTDEQVLDIPHPIGSVPAPRQVYADSLADNAIDTSPACWDYIKYDDAGSSATIMRFRVKLLTAYC